MDCALCGSKGLFQVEDLPVGPRWFCTEKHFAEYAGLPVKEFGYYGLEAESFEADTAPSVEGMIDNPAGYYSYWQSFCEYLGVTNVMTAWRMVEKPWKWRPELEEWVNDPEWFSQEAESFEAEESKKLPPVEKAIDTGIASGATMEGLDLALGAESFSAESFSPNQSEWKLRDVIRNLKGDEELECSVCNTKLKIHKEDRPDDSRYWISRWISCSKCLYKIGYSSGWLHGGNDIITCGICDKRVRESELDENDEVADEDLGSCDYCEKNNAKSEFPPVKGYWEHIDPAENHKRGYCSQECFVGSLGECDDCRSPFKIGDNYNLIDEDDDATLHCDDCFKGYPICEFCDVKYHPEGEHNLSLTCSYCRGDGYIMTSYTPSTYYDPAESDGHDCEACGGSGSVCSEGEGYDPYAKKSAESYTYREWEDLMPSEQETFKEEAKLESQCDNCTNFGEFGVDIFTDKEKKDWVEDKRLCKQHKDELITDKSRYYFVDWPSISLGGFP